jgi:hypothetical protein
VDNLIEWFGVSFNECREEDVDAAIAVEGLDEVEKRRRALGGGDKE